jgi:hypothetical protein
VQTPVVQTPVVQTPVVQTPVVQTPVVQTPVVQPVADFNSILSRLQNGINNRIINTNYVIDLVNKVNAEHGTSMRAITDIVGNYDLIEKTSVIMTRDGL